MALASAALEWFDRDCADDVPEMVRAACNGEHQARGRMQRELVERAQRGDADAFRELVYEAGRRLYAIANRILRDPDRAQDALQQALIQLWDGLPGLRDPDRFDAWSYRLVVHASYREARHERSWTARVGEIRADPPGDEGVAEVIDRDEVERSFRRSGSTITGGTGRFAGATGGFLWSVRFWGEVGPSGMPVNPWHFEGSLEGTISY